MSDGRLLAAELRTVISIAEEWEITVADMATLLGMSRATYRLQRLIKAERGLRPPERQPSARGSLIRRSRSGCRSSSESSAFWALLR